MENIKTEDETTKSTQQPKALTYCVQEEDINKSSSIDGYAMESNDSTDNGVQSCNPEIKIETDTSMLECKDGNFELVKAMKPANNNDINLPNLSSTLNSIDHKCMTNESSLNNHVFSPDNVLYPLSIPKVNPASNDFTLIEDKLSEQTYIPTGLTQHSDHSTVISNCNTESDVKRIVSNNHSLAQLASYDSDESLHEEIPKTSHNYREPKSKIEESDDSDSDSSSSSSSTSVIISDSSDIDSCEYYENNQPRDHKPIKAKGELDLDDLPPIEDLKISVPEDECILIGKVFQIVDKLVVIQAMRDTPAYDLDTVLFVEGGQPLGKIFDVFGPVAEPFYSVRFNSNDHIKNRNITLNQKVYSAPKTKYTKFVFVAQLMKMKGSDASWKNDEEPPEIYLDYSDDEQEQRAKKNKCKNKKAVMKVDLDPDEPARKKHFAYERRMNEKNLEMSAIRNHQNTRRTTNYVWRMDNPTLGPSTSKYTPFQNDSQQMFGNPPVFNSQIPPPHGLQPGLVRPNMFSAQSSQNSPNNVQFVPHYRRFMSPNQSQMIPSNCQLGNSGGIEVPNYSFPQSPAQLHPPVSFGNQSPSPSFYQPSNSNNAWPHTPPPTTPAMERQIHPTNRLPPSPFWIQRPTMPFNQNIQRPFSGVRNMYIAPCPPRLWPMQNIRNDIPPNNRLPLNFIPYAPPPSPNYHKF